MNLTYVPLTYVPFNPHRPVSEYVGQAAPQGGMLLPPEGYDALASSKVTGLPCQYAVIGEDRCEDGRIYLRLGVTRDWLEAATNYREADGQLRWTCPECGSLGGKHQRRCGYAA